MKTQVYFASGFDSIEDVEAEYGHIFDATELSKIPKCPRYHETRVEENLERPGTNAKMVAGIAMHEGCDYYYAHPERTPAVEEDSIQVVRDTWNDFELDRANMDSGATHLSENHLAKVLENYFYEWKHKKIEIFTPITLTLEDLDLTRVLAAKFKLTPDGQIILGESNLVMKFEVRGEPFILAGKPDLPVRKQDGSVYVMDHKTTSGYLSDWWAAQFEASNKLRGYMAMTRELLGVQPLGAVINGIYVGKYATNPDSKATKFHRYSFDFTPAHVEEALENQWAWMQTIKFYREQLGYFPQGCGWGGCQHPDLCRRDPPTRALVKDREYQESTRRFWDL